MRENHREDDPFLRRDVPFQHVAQCLRHAGQIRAGSGGGGVGGQASDRRPELVDDRGGVGVVAGQRREVGAVRCAGADERPAELVLGPVVAVQVIDEHPGERPQGARLPGRERAAVPRQSPPERGQLTGLAHDRPVGEAVELEIWFGIAGETRLHGERKTMWARSGL